MRRITRSLCGAACLAAFADHTTFKTVATVQVFAEGDAPLCGEGLH